MARVQAMRFEGLGLKTVMRKEKTTISQKPETKPVQIDAWER